MFRKLKKNLINIPGKKIHRKFLSFESDDWGTIRIPNRKIQETLIAQNLISSKDPFSAYDRLESEDDIESLFSCLSKFKDSKNNPPIITANTVVANPNFEKIKTADFSAYFFEDFRETYKRYKDCEGSFTLFKSGIDNKFLYPQFHAREHVNLPLWMNLLRKRDGNFTTAFDLECFSINFIDPSNPRSNLMASYDYHSKENFEVIKKSIDEGLELFEKIFGFESQSTVAPCYVWDDKIEKVFKENNVNFLQGSRFQNVPVQHSGKLESRFHYNGETNQHGQYYFQRNGLFEPSINVNIDWVDKCLESISIAFKWGKPAIIGTHRLNFIGGLNEKNRTKNLQLMEQLLIEVLKKWPDVEFVPSTIIQNAYKNHA